MDLSLFDYLNGWAGKSAWLDAILVFAVEYLQYWVVAGFFVWVFCKYKNNWKAVLTVAVSSVVLSRLFITELIRFIYFRPRPFAVMDVYELVSHSPSAAFPSGHAAFFFALSTAVFLYDKFWGTVFVILSLWLTFARVAAGIHWPSDILGGAVVGIFSGVLVFYVMKRYRSI